MKVHPASIAVTVTGLCVGLGCPQLRDDDFLKRSIDAADGGTPSGSGGATGGQGLGGSGGARPCDAGSSGCGADTILVGGAGAGGSDPAPTDGGAGAGAGPADCALDESTGPNGACYFADSGESTWSEARASCQSRGDGWDLAAIGDAAEDGFVLSLTGYEAWVGATDIDTEGAWVWVNEGTPFFLVGAVEENTRFNNWTDGEPNDYDGSDCMRILTTGLWADWPCDSLLGHVCRRAPP
jgi:lectin-like protein